MPRQRLTAAPVYSQSLLEPMVAANERSLEFLQKLSDFSCKNCPISIAYSAILL